MGLKSYDDSLQPLISVRFMPFGGVAEWLNALVLKTSEGESPPSVRIRPPPPVFLIHRSY